MNSERNGGAPRPTSRRRWIWGVAAVAALASMAGVAAVGGCKHTSAARVRMTADEVRSAQAFPFDVYDRILHEYVDTNGKVNYVALRRNRGELDRVLAYVADAGPAARPDLYPTQNHRLAFYIAAYNATVFRNVIDREPIRNIDDHKVSFFYSTRFPVDGQEINLVDLENNRVRSVFHDPRVHFALNCASGGCPRLPNEAFVPDRVDAQLDREARRFCNEDRNVHVDTAARKVVLSKIFDWYSSDFVEYERAHGNANGNQITFINRFRAQDAQVPADLEMEFRDYDWTINAQAAEGQTPSS